MRIGFDVGGTKVLAGVVDGAGRVVATHRMDSRPELDATATVERLVDQVLGLLADADAEPGRLRAVGFGFPGDFAADGTLVTIPNLPRLVGCDPAALFRDAFARRTGCRPPVAADNDTVVAVLAEARFGAGRGARRLIYVTVSTGVGGARYDGRRAENVEPGLRLHPDPEQPGERLEDLAGGAALARRLRRELAALVAEGGEEALTRRTRVLDYVAGPDTVSGRLDQLTARHLGQAATDGDAWAQAVLDRAADHVAAGLALLLAQGWGEERIVVGGAIALRTPGYLDRLRRTLGTLQQRPEAAPGLVRFPLDQLVPAGLGEERGILGAVLLTD